jgi:glutamate-ammonia-ligase adenylyltransferase
VLRYSAVHPQLTANAGNIALLHRSGELGLIDAQLATAVADAYRLMRKLQHQLRLQGRDTARVPHASVAGPSASVLALWSSVFG